MYRKGIYVSIMATIDLTYKDLLQRAQFLSVIACQHICLGIFKMLQKQGKLTTSKKRKKELTKIRANILAIKRFYGTLTQPSALRTYVSLATLSHGWTFCFVD